MSDSPIERINQTSGQLRGGFIPRRSIFTVIAISVEAVWIVDNFDEPRPAGAHLTVTNDAEGVCEELAMHYDGRKIYYRDTDGNWDELQHLRGKFTGFAPARDKGVAL